MGRLTVAVGLVVAWLVSATPIAACSSDSPSFAAAVRDARAVARMTVVHHPAGVYAGDTAMTLRIVHVLRGPLPHVVTIDPPVSSLCGDWIGYHELRPGDEVIVALDVPFYGQVIHPAWWMTSEGRLFGTAGVPDEVADLDALAHAIDALPNTATMDARADAAGSVLVALIVAALAGLAANVHWRRLHES